MMYMLRFQKSGPYHWGDINVVVGDINAVHVLYNALVSAANRPKGAPIAADVRVVGAAHEPLAPVYEWGTFRPAGERVDNPPLVED